MLKDDYEEELKKIEKVCNEEDLEFHFVKASFPVIATIEPTWQAKDQMRMDLGESAESITNGEIKFIFADELTMSIVNDFMIEDALLNKIKNAAKKLHYIYLQMYFKEKTYKIGGVNYDKE